MKIQINEICTNSISFIQDQYLLIRSDQQQKILAVVTLAFASLAILYLARRYYFKGNAFSLLAVQLFRFEAIGKKEDSWYHDPRITPLEIINPIEIDGPGKGQKTRITTWESFLNPIREEEAFDSEGKPLKKVQMMANHFLVTLNSKEDSTNLLKSLESNFPQVTFSLNPLTYNRLVFCLNFEPSADYSLIKLFSAVRRKIEEEKLAKYCAPNILFDLEKK